MIDQVIGSEFGFDEEPIERVEDVDCRCDDEERHSRMLAEELRINTDGDESRIVNDEDEYCDTLREANKGHFNNGFKNDTNGRFDGDDVIFHKEGGKFVKTTKPIQKQVMEYDLIYQGGALIPEGHHFSHGSGK